MTLTMTTPAQFKKCHTISTVPDRTLEIRAIIELALQAKKLIIPINGADMLTRPFEDLSQVFAVLRDYQSIGWDCALVTERRPGGKSEIVFREPC